MNAPCRAALVLIALMTGCDAGTSDESTQSGFTGETLTLLYVTDVGKSVAFYEAIGFDLDFFYDYRAGAYAIEWKQPYVPEYAEVVQPGIRIGLTTVDEPNPVYGGGVRHYFMIDDVYAHYEMIKSRGIVPVPDEVEVRPWMSFITVPDPDNHQIVFGMKNQAYYDQARDEINSLDP